MIAALDFSPTVSSFLGKLSPTLVAYAAEIDAALVTNAAVDAELDAFDADEVAAQKIEDASWAVLVFADFQKIEDGFALVGVPLIDATAPTVEAWAVPIVASFCTPAFAPFVSAGLLAACKCANLLLDKWAAQHNKPKAGA
jgi:hypothetical protein